jgi:hypothetical protein
MLALTGSRPGTSGGSMAGTTGGGTMTPNAIANMPDSIANSSTAAAIGNSFSNLHSDYLCVKNYKRVSRVYIFTLD